MALYTIDLNVSTSISWRLFDDLRFTRIMHLVASSSSHPTRYFYGDTHQGKVFVLYVMHDSVLHNIFKMPSMIGLRGEDRSATTIIAKLVAFLFVRGSVRSNTKFT